MLSMRSLWRLPGMSFSFRLTACQHSDAVRALSRWLTISELAYQISQQITSLGAPLGVRTATIVGGMDMMSQSIALSKRPHVIVATPGRLMDHLENTKGFSLKALKYLVSPYLIPCMLRADCCR